MLRTSIIGFLLMAASMWAARAAEYSVTSPNGKLKVTLNTIDGDKTTYTVSLLKDDGAWRPLISPSPISMTIKDRFVWGGKDATISRVTFDTVAGRVSPLPVGKTSSLVESYREVAIRYAQGYSIVARAYNEGVAYRFASHVTASARLYVANEEANFTFAEQVKVWYPAMSGGEGTGENYERWYTTFPSIAAINESMVSRESDFTWCVTPALFGFDGGAGVKVAITEADLHRYPTLYLRRGSPTGMKGRWSFYPKETTPGSA